MGNEKSFVYWCIAFTLDQPAHPATFFPMEAVDLVATELALVVPVILHYIKLLAIVVQKRGNHPDEQGGGIKSTAPLSGKKRYADDHRLKHQFRVRGGL